MSLDSFHRMLMRTCTNGPMDPADMQFEIDLIDDIVSQTDSTCEDAVPAYCR